MAFWLQDLAEQIYIKLLGIAFYTDVEQKLYFLIIKPLLAYYTMHVTYACWSYSLL